VDQANLHGIHLDKAILEHIVVSNSKKRFSFNEQRSKIRASQGHSLEIELGLVDQKPPDILYHGTGQKSVLSILKKGVEKQKRQYVHLSIDIETAVKVGKRHGKPFIFEVYATKMHEDGFKFFISDNGIWLTDHIPAEYFKITSPEI